jgi:nucleoside-diphosphate-sugar epimerase
MTVLVTGAAGFLGSHVTDLLLASGERPRVLIRPGDGRGPLEAAGADIYTGDIGDRATIGAALRGVDRVLHCAARTGPWGPAADYERTNVRGLETLVTAALAAGVRRVVHVSSITVHGNDVGGQADETAPLREEPNPYSRSKVAGERLLERLIRDQGAPVTIVRPGWIYGPRDTASFARLARMIERGQMIMFGRGTNHLPLIYARDAARGVLLASAADGAEGRPYLLVNDEPVTQRDFLRAIAAGLGAPAPTRHLPYRLATLAGAIAEDLGRLAGRRQPPSVMRYGIQLLGGENRFIISRSRRELGFSPHVDLAEGVRRSVEWYLGASRAAERAAVHQRADGRGAAWTEERGTSDEGRRRLKAPRRGAGDTA